MSRSIKFEFPIPYRNGRHAPLAAFTIIDGNGSPRGNPPKEELVLNPWCRDEFGRVARTCTEYDLPSAAHP